MTGSRARPTDMRHAPWLRRNSDETMSNGAVTEMFDTPGSTHRAGWLPPELADGPTDPDVTAPEDAPPVPPPPRAWHLLDESGRLEPEVVFRSALTDPSFVPDTGYGWRRRQPPPRLRRRRNPAAGLATLVLLGLLAAFFGWFSAEPLWLSLGHGVPGTATVVPCSVHGIDSRCAQFTPDGDAYPPARVTLLGRGDVPTGQSVPARMVSPGGWQAYAGDPAGLYLRWVPGLALVLLCGIGIAWGTGATRLPGRSRVIAVVGSIAGPLLLAAGLFVAAW
jgi:hypothetical protein